MCICSISKVNFNFYKLLYVTLTFQFTNKIKIIFVINFRALTSLCTLQLGIRTIILEYTKILFNTRKKEIIVRIKSQSSVRTGVFCCQFMDRNPCFSPSLSLCNLSLGISQLFCYFFFFSCLFF